MSLEKLQEQFKKTLTGDFSENILSVMLIAIAIVWLLVAVYTALYVKSKGVKAVMIAYMLLP